MMLLRGFQRLFQKESKKRTRSVGLKIRLSKEKRKKKCLNQSCTDMIIIIDIVISD